MDLDDLRRRFRERCQNDFDKLLSMPAPAVAIETAEGKDQLIAISHRISGGGGIFGFGHLSDVAHDLESLLIEQSVDRSALGSAFDALLDALRDVVSEKN